MAHTDTKKHNYILSFTKAEKDVYYCLLRKNKLLAEGPLPCSVLAFNGLFDKLKACKVDFSSLVCCVERQSMRIFPLVFVAQHNLRLHILSLPSNKAYRTGTQKDKVHALARYGYQQQYQQPRHLISPHSQDKAHRYWYAKQQREELEAMYSRFDQKLVKVTQLLKEAREDAANYNFFVVEDVF